MANFHFRIVLATIFLFFGTFSFARGGHGSGHDTDEGSQVSYSTVTPEWAPPLAETTVDPGEPKRQPANATPLNFEEKLALLRIEAGKVMSEDIHSRYCIERICRTLKQIQTEIDEIHYDQVSGKTAEQRAQYFANLTSDERNSLLKFVTNRLIPIVYSDEALKLSASTKIVSDLSKLKADIEKSIQPTPQQIQAAKSILEKNGVEVTPNAQSGTAEFAFKDIKAFQAKIGAGDRELVKAFNTLSPGLGNELARNTLEGEAFNRHVAAPADALTQNDRAILARYVPEIIKEAESGKVPQAPISLKPALETLARAAQFEINIGKENLTPADRLALAQARGIAYNQIFNNPITQATKPAEYRAILGRANELVAEVNSAIKGTSAKNQIYVAQATRTGIKTYNELIVGNKANGDAPLDELIKQASKAAAFYVDPSALSFSRENQYRAVLDNRFKALEDTAKDLKLRGANPELVKTLEKTTQDIRNAFVAQQSAAAEQYAKDAKSAIISAGVGIATLGAGSVLAGTFKVASGSFALASTAGTTTAAAATALTARQVVTQASVRLFVGGTAGASINGTLAAASNIAHSYDEGKPISFAAAGKAGLSAAKEGGVVGAGLAVLPRPVQQAAGIFFSSRQGASALEHAADRKLASAAVDLIGAYAVPVAIERVAKIGQPKDTAYTPQELAALKELVPQLEAQRGRPINPSEYGSILERSRNLKRYTGAEKDLTPPSANERLNEAGLLFSGQNTDPLNQMTLKANPTSRAQNLHVVLSETLTRLGDVEKLAQLPYKQLVERVGENVRENYNPAKNPAAADAVAKAGADYIKSLTPLGDSRFRVVPRAADAGPLTLAEAQSLLSGKVEGGLKSTTTSTKEALGFYPQAASNTLVVYEVPKGTKGVLINGEGPVAQAARAEQASRGNLGFAQNEVAVNIKPGSLQVGEIKTINLADGRTVFSVKLVPTDVATFGRYVPKSVPVLNMNE